MEGDIHSVFNANWYLSRYPDVEMSGLEPLDHYLRYGERLGRKASLKFDPLFYKEHCSEVVDSENSLLIHFFNIGMHEGRRGHAESIRDYMQQLWRREHIVDCLDGLASFTNNKKTEYVRSACWQLARWYAWQEDWHYCNHWLWLYYQQPSPEISWPSVQLLYCESLCRIGELEKSEIQADCLKENFPAYYDTYLAYSNIYLSQLIALLPNEDEEKISLLNKCRIESINTIFYNYGLTQIKIKKDSKLSLDTLQSISFQAKSKKIKKKDCLGVDSDDVGLVSVIVPVFNAEPFLETALQSLAAQTYTNFEVLIVNDASTDKTSYVAKKIVAQDDRFKLLSLPYNKGAYVARNYGLKFAKGSFISVHDADDWSHPDKLAYQVAAFQKNPDWVANTSDMVRCTTDLRFGRWRLPNSPNGGWIYRNTSSLMFKRIVFDTLGYWDRVRCTADTEYIHRIIAAFGEKSYGQVLQGVPLSFCRHQEGSLSQIGPLHLITHEKGVRRDYMRFARKWHASALKATDLYLADSPYERPFETPVLNLLT
ncbi:glycosyltransferase family 2 protein [Vreelandella aquamarina]